MLVLFSFMTSAAGDENVTSVVQLTGNIPTSTIELNDVGGEGDDLIPLLPNATRLVSCWGSAGDDDGLSDLVDVNAWLFSTSASFRNDADNLSQHYRNFSCDTTDLALTGEWNCTFNVQYFALNDTWNCSVNITNTDPQYYNDTVWDTAIVEELLALTVHNTSIDFGLRAVDVVYDADLPVLIYNEGNVGIDIQVDAWEQNATFGQETNSDAAFNCSIGPSVPITSLAFNATQAATFSDSTLLQSGGATSVFTIDLPAQVGGAGILPTVANTYWGIFIPVGTSGACNGYIQYIGLRDI